MINERIGNISVGDNEPPKIVGVINISPESFYKDSVITAQSDNLINYVEKMIQDGVDIIDVGAASTAPPNKYPWAKYVSEAEELERITTFLKNVRSQFDLLISIDTQRASVAEKALTLGANIINDVSGLKHDPKMAQIIAQYDAYAFLMATNKKPGDVHSIYESYYALKKSIEIACAAGVNPKKIVVDPGIGFGKSTEEDLELIGKLRILKLLRKPILVGISRKAFIGDILSLPNPKDRLFGSLAATAVAVLNSAHLIRTHDVLPTKQVVTVAYRLKKVSQIESDRVEFIDFGENLDIIEFILSEINVQKEIMSSLATKGVFLRILLRDVPVPEALIIKQEMLAVGGDAAYHYETIDFDIEKTDLLIMGTLYQVKRMKNKIKKMHFGSLNNIATRIDDLLNKFSGDHN
ncbi:MAG: dihydropteroate synthase [Candidatus Odinarchaeota archaeon]|nr:dihydropteroate synthase [Candidatus Odinarchaeota archaeon]